VREVELSGPTNFSPLIKEAIKIVKQTNEVRQTFFDKQI
jgi:hypothetical protein